MPTLSSTGIGSGLQVESIISALMAVERKPLAALQTQENTLNTQLSSVGKLKSLLSTLRDKANALTQPSLWGQTVATSSDPARLGVSTGSGAVAGNYAVSVQALARGQTLTSTVTAGTSVNEGTLTIELGTWVGDPATSFTAKPDSSAITVTIGPGENTLAQLRDKINAAGAGVTASIINDASGARLALRSSETGAANGFRISAAETVDDGDATTGLSAFSYDAAGGASQMTRPVGQEARNALATINGIAIESTSNSLTNVADGLSLTLLGETTTPVTVTVADDKAAVKQGIDEFVKAFNELASTIREQTKYDATTKKAGPLQGDRSVIGLQSQLRNALNVMSTASSAFGRLSDVGIVMNAEGSLEQKSSRVDAALNNLGELRKLFAEDGADTAGTGFMRRFRELADAALGTDGSMESRNTALKSRIKRIDDQQAQMELRLELREKRLRAQYEALDTNMGKLGGLSSFVSQQMASLTYNYNKG